MGSGLKLSSPAVREQKKRPQRSCTQQKLELERVPTEESSKMYSVEVGKEDDRFAKDHIRRQDGFAYLCAVCNEFGDLLCCELCAQGFHLSCIGLDSVPAEKNWLCQDCTNGQVQCFQCKQFGCFQKDLRRCSFKKCNKFYHERCMKTWNAHVSSTKSNIVCPHHVCNACSNDRNSKHWRLFRCLDCPTAYHEKCSPDGMELLEDIPGFMLCGNHNEDGCQSDHFEPVKDLKVVFDRLPLPDSPIAFKIPRTVKIAAKKLDNMPPKYIHIRRNIYLTKRPRRRLDDEYMQCSCRVVEGSKVCTSECLCKMLLSSCSENCACGGNCENVPFQKRTGRKLKAVKTEDCGWGVMAEEDIKRGEFLIEYVGEVIDDKECEDRLWDMKKHGETNFYLCEISREFVIDASFKGNVSRFINHSCKPNTVLQKWDMDGETRIGVFAKADIAEGEHITYDYKFIQFGTDQKCYCGTSECRGQLGVKPNKHKLYTPDISTKLLDGGVLITCKKTKACGSFSLEHGMRSINPVFQSRKESTVKGEATKHTGQNTEALSYIGLRIKVWWPLDQRYYSGIIKSYDLKTGKHKIEYDDGDQESLCLSKEIWLRDTQPIAHSQCKRRILARSNAL